jgi:hypothetical protein
MQSALVSPVLGLMQALSIRNELLRHVDNYPANEQS